MRMDHVRKLLTMFALGCIVLSTSLHAITITASDDTWVREDNPNSNRDSDGLLNARTDLDGDDNDVILLRFSTSVLSAPVVDSRLTLFWQRSDGNASNALSLYGLNESHVDETIWSESLVTYNDAPGLLPDGQNPSIEFGLAHAFDDVRDLDLANLTPLVLGQPYGPQILNDAYSFASSALTDFINADTNNEVTFLIVRANESGNGNQARFWASESGLAPVLTINAVPEPGTVLLIALAGIGLIAGRRQAGDH